MRCLVGFGVGMPLSPSRLSESFDHVEQEREVGERGRRAVAGAEHVGEPAVGRAARAVVGGERGQRLTELTDFITHRKF